MTEGHHVSYIPPSKCKYSNFKYIIAVSLSVCPELPYTFILSQARKPYHSVSCECWIKDKHVSQHVQKTNFAVMINNEYGI